MIEEGGQAASGAMSTPRSNNPRRQETREPTAVAGLDLRHTGAQYVTLLLLRTR